MTPTTIVMLIEALIKAGVEAATAWTTVSEIVAAKRDPTSAEWAVAGVDADEAHAAVAGLK